MHHDHSIIACSRHTLMGVILRTHPICGESCIQHLAHLEVASLQQYQTIVAIGNPEQHVHKALHCGSKQQ